jgi:hypothetical protein
MVMPIPTVKPPKVDDSFWPKYSRHFSAIQIDPFQMDEINIMVSEFADKIDNAVNWGKESATRDRLIHLFRTSLIERTHRGALMDREVFSKREVGCG